LVNFLGVSRRVILTEPVYRYTRTTLARRTVAEMLARAAASLPGDLRLGVVEGWRPRYIQRRMYLTQLVRFRTLHPEWPEVHLRRVVNRITHPPDAAAPPPHVSGGAVDVVLVDVDERRLDHHSPYKPWDPRSYAAVVKGLSPEAKRNRATLREAMLGAGFTNYPSEYWHWSYGDQGWAYRGPWHDRPGREHADQTTSAPHARAVAIYGPVDHPEGWTPVPEDDVEEPLERVWGAGESSGFPRVADG
jgi:D-alanyl-D-alanine dipeptidase